MAQPDGPHSDMFTFPLTKLGGLAELMVTVFDVVPGGLFIELWVSLVVTALSGSGWTGELVLD